MNDHRGALWRKWDLHVHSPESLHHGYGRGGADPWEEFLNELESLPEEFKVIGINDYLFIDGYRRVRAAKAAGRLANLEAIFPVIELRIDRFGGADGHLRRVNLHVIFSDELDSDVIQAQFINALNNKFVLSPVYAGAVRWDASLTRESLAELGQKIKATIPAERRHEFGGDLAEGFANLNVRLEDVQALLGRPVFVGNSLLAVGKTEWAAIKWNDQSIADKKTIINSADLVFVAANDVDHWRRNQTELASAQVNSRLLDCSDAHHPSSSDQKDRLGNCFSWICADATFQGLKHAIQEYPDRVFVGTTPPKVLAVRNVPGRYMRRLETRKKQGSPLAGTWFDVGLDLNPGFVAVIGNKGRGKSALADTLGLLGSSRNQPSFSFLSAARFRNPKANHAAHFQASLTWESGETVTRALDADVGLGEVERVKYLPQSLLENICNEPPDSPGRFERELGEVIFSHVPPADRLEQTDLEALLALRTAGVDQRVAILRAELHVLNTEILRFEEQSTPAVKIRIENEQALRVAELAALDAAPPGKVDAPQEDPEQDPALAEGNRRLADALAERSQVQILIDAAGEEAKKQALRAAAAERVVKLVENLQHQHETFMQSVQVDVATLELDVHRLAFLKTDVGQPEEIRLDAESKKLASQSQLDVTVDGSAALRLGVLDAELETLRERLSEPNRKYQEYLAHHEAWRVARDTLIGDATTPGTISQLQAALAALAETPKLLATARERRIGKAIEIHAEYRELANVYRSVYAPVQQFVSQHELARDRFSLDFQVALSESGFERALFERVNRQVTGSFSGIEEGGAVLNAWLATTDFDLESDVQSFLQSIDAALHTDQRTGKGQPVDLTSQLRKGVAACDVYDLVFGLGYISPHYVLESRGKPISQLSPGEKGTLLLMFYLLVDKADTPIVLDQPEENLDNQTIHDLLVPAVKEARRRRQVILVTHNPNLAVVGDADQVIRANFDGDTFTYTSGAIENPEQNEDLVNILEGTRPAFDNRDLKYLPARPSPN